ADRHDPGEREQEDHAPLMGEQFSSITDGLDRDQRRDRRQREERPAKPDRRALSSIAYPCDHDACDLFAIVGTRPVSRGVPDLGKEFVIHDGKFVSWCSVRRSASRCRARVSRAPMLLSESPWTLAISR